MVITITTSGLAYASAIVGAVCLGGAMLVHLFGKARAHDEAITRLVAGGFTAFIAWGMLVSHP